ncbi:MAG: tetratricopeptide repeat protein [Chitinivibrionia bacterium]|nr:tetratricopeptide repeat protein [Chitinivibrionia bacterium]
MKKYLFLLHFFAAVVFAGEFTLDFNSIDPLTSAIFRGVEAAFEVNEKGLNALESGNFEEAEKLFVKASGMLPIYSDAKNNLGVLFYRTNREYEAQNIWENITKSDPEYIMAWYNLGLWALRRNNIKEAKKYIETAYLKEQNIGDIWAIYSYILAQTKETAKAIKILEAKVPAPAALKMLGEIYAVEGDFNKAKTYLERLKGVKNVSRDFYETLAAVYNELKMFKNTEELFAEVQNSGDEISLSLGISYAWALYEQGQKETSARILKGLSISYPEDRSIKARLIYILINDQKFDEAKIILDEMGKNDDNNFSIEFFKGYAAMSTQKYEESKKSLEKALKISPNDNSAKGLLAYVLINLGDEKRSEKLWSELSKTDPNNNQSLINLAVLSERKNRPDSALIYYRRAIKIADNPGVRVSMGNIFFDKKQFDSAMVHYKFAFDSAQWRTKALTGGYFSALGFKDTAFADKISALLGIRDTGDNVNRVLSDNFYRKGDFENSVKLAKNILEPIAEDYLRLAWAYIELKDIKGAQEAVESAKKLKANESEIAKLSQQIAFAAGDYSSALNFKDNSPDGIYNRAVILYKNKDYSQALNQSIMAADLFSGSKKTEMVRIAANSAAAMKDWKAALRWFSLLNQFEANAQNALNVAIAAYNENNIALMKEFYLSAKKQDATIYSKDIEARLEYEERPKEEPPVTIVFSSSDSLYNAALNFHLSGDKENALKLYEELLSVDKNFYRAWNNMGTIYGEKGEIEKAISAYENAVGRRADIVDGYVNLVNIYSAINDVNNAKKWLKKGLKIAPKDENLLFFKKQLGE